MLLKILKKNQILLFVLLFLISLSIMLLTKKSDEANLIEKENTILKNIPKIVTQVQQEVELNKINPTTPNRFSRDFLLYTPTFDNKIDFIGTSKPLIYSEPQLEIEQIMQEHKKINTFAQEKYLIDKKEDWKINYGIGLEGNAIENLKANGRLKTKMLNGKIEFSTSF